MNRNIKNILRDSLALLPDKQFCSLTFTIRHKRFPSLKNPKLLYDKLLYLKLTSRDPIQKILADKYEVRKFVKERIGEAYLIPLIGVYQSSKEIDINALPDKFALKPTTSSSYNLICTDKKTLDWKKEFDNIDKFINLDFYKKTREWQYKDLPKRFVIENHIADVNGNTYDYKFWCFNGVPTFVQVDSERFDNHKRDIFDIDFNRLELKIVYENSKHEITKPKNYEKMVELAKELSKGLNFIRVDLYNIDGKIYFGELTFYPDNCNGTMYPSKYEKIYGDMLII